MKNTIINYWRQLEKRDQAMLIWGSLIVSLILFYAIIWQPWHYAISQMEKGIQPMRGSLVWMRQQSELVKGGGATTQSEVKGLDQSLMSVIEQTAKASKIRKSIQQMMPGRTKQEVSLVLEEADFNQWLRWVDVLFKQYAVNIKQVSAERDGDKPNIAEIRVTFERV